MTKRTYILIFSLLGLLSLGYAIYRSTSVRTTVMENGMQIVYGEPQHGLILGLCVLAGTCILGIVLLLMDRKDWTDDAKMLSKRTVEPFK